ncbi:unnamed protein product, partial [Discosporangium mesarthrocarpum]
QAPRTHRIPPRPDGRPVPVGWTTVQAVQEYVADHPEQVGEKMPSLVPHLTLTARVTGVRYRDEESGEERDLRAGAVVLTTGAGYAFDRSEGSLLAEHAPKHLHLATTSGPQATGDGVRLGQAVGAELVDMDQIQARLRTCVHPTSLVDPADPTNLSKFLAPESMRGSGGLLVDGSGRRFVNELATRVVVTQAIFDHGEVTP